MPDFLTELLKRQRANGGDRTFPSFGSLAPPASVMGTAQPAPMPPMIGPIDVGVPAQARLQPGDVSPIDQFRANQAVAALLEDQPKIPGPSIHGGGGFLSRLKDTLKGAGLGFVAGSAEGGGIGGGIGGAIFGGVASGINPNVAHRMQYNLWEKPKLEAERARAVAEQRQKAAIFQDLAQTTGTIPGTNVPTLAGRKLEDQADRYAQSAYIAQQRLLDTQRRTDLTERKMEVQQEQFKIRNELAKDAFALKAGMRPGSKFTPAQMAHFKELGIDVVELYDPKFFIHDVDDRGNTTITPMGQTGTAYAPTILKGAGKTKSVGGQGSAAIRRQTQQQLFQEWKKAGRIPADNLVPNPNYKLTEDEAFEIALTKDPAAKAAKEAEIRSKHKIPYYSHPDFKAELQGRIDAAPATTGAQSGADQARTKMAAAIERITKSSLPEEEKTAKIGRIRQAFKDATGQEP